MNVGELGGRIPFFCVNLAPSYPRIISPFYSIFDVDKTLEEINFFLLNYVKFILPHNIKRFLMWSDL